MPSDVVVKADETDASPVPTLNPAAVNDEVRLVLPLVLRTRTIDGVKLALDDAVADPEINLSGIAVTDAVAVFVANASLTRKADDVDDSDADNDIASEILIMSALDDVVLAHDVLALDDVVLSAVDVTDAVALDVPDPFVTNCNDAVAVMLADAVAAPNDILLAADVVVAEDDVDADPSIT